MILSIIRIFPRGGLEQSTLDILESLKGPVAAAAGCLGCSISVETGEGRVVFYLEQWRSREALERHMRSPLYGRLLEAMECSRLPPDVEFYEATGVGGLDLVERTRLPH
jgi:quinol monooxygenase YgiN